MQIDSDTILRETNLFDLIHLDRVDSTNTYAQQLAQTDSPAASVLVVADEQTAGRGQRGNLWWTGEGALAMTLILPDGGQAEAADGGGPLIALAASIALVEATRPLVEPPSRIAPTESLGIHWPNDVFLGSRKLAGVLVQRLASPPCTLVGVGVNTNNTAADAPQPLRQIATTLRDATGRPVDHTRLIVDWLYRFDAARRLADESPATLADLADAMCLQRGQMLTVERGKETLTGQCRGIAPDGGLRLAVDQGEIVIHSGRLVH